MGLDHFVSALGGPLASIRRNFTLETEKQWGQTLRLGCLDLGMVAQAWRPRHSIGWGKRVLSSVSVWLHGKTLSQKNNNKRKLCLIFLKRVHLDVYVFMHMYVYTFIFLSAAPIIMGQSQEIMSMISGCCSGSLGSSGVVTYWYMIGILQSNGYPCFMESWSLHAAAEDLCPKEAGTQGWSRASKPRFSSDPQEVHPLSPPGVTAACWPAKLKERLAVRTLDLLSAALFSVLALVPVRQWEGGQRWAGTICHGNGVTNSHPSQPSCGLPGEMVTKKKEVSRELRHLPSVASRVQRRSLEGPCVA